MPRSDKPLTEIHSLQCGSMDLTPFLTGGYDTTPLAGSQQWEVWLQRFSVSEKSIEALAKAVRKLDNQFVPVRINGYPKLVSVTIDENEPDMYHLTFNGETPEWCELKSLTILDVDLTVHLWEAYNITTLDAEAFLVTFKSSRKLTPLLGRLENDVLTHREPDYIPYKLNRQLRYGQCKFQTKMNPPRIILRRPLISRLPPKETSTPPPPPRTAPRPSTGPSVLTEGSKQS